MRWRRQGARGSFSASVVRRHNVRAHRQSSAGFYASPFGFLPYTVSREPLDIFAIVEAL